MRFFGKFNFIILNINPSCQTVSKAFSKSIRQAPTDFFEFRDHQQSDVNFAIALTVECPLLNPNCQFGITLFV